MNNLELLELANQGDLLQVFPHIQLLKIATKQWDKNQNLIAGSCFIFVPQQPDVVCDPEAFYLAAAQYKHGQPYSKNCISFFAGSDFVVIDSVQIFKTIDIPEFFFFNNVQHNSNITSKFLFNERNDLFMDSNSAEYCIKLSKAIVDNVDMKITKTIRFGKSDVVFSKINGQPTITETILPRELPIGQTPRPKGRGLV